MVPLRSRIELPIATAPRISRKKPVIRGEIQKIAVALDAISLPQATAIFLYILYFHTAIQAINFCWQAPHVTRKRSTIPLFLCSSSLCRLCRLACFFLRTRWTVPQPEDDKPTNDCNKDHDDEQGMQTVFQHGTEQASGLVTQTL